SSSTSTGPVPGELFSFSSAAPLSVPVNVAAPTGRLPATKIVTAIATLVHHFITNSSKQRLMCRRAQHIPRRCCKFRKLGRWSTRLVDASLLARGNRGLPLITASIIPVLLHRGITPQPIVTEKTRFPGAAVVETPANPGAARDTSSPPWPTNR